MENGKEFTHARPVLDGNATITLLPLDKNSKRHNSRGRKENVNGKRKSVKGGGTNWQGDRNSLNYCFS